MPRRGKGTDEAERARAGLAGNEVLQEEREPISGGMLQQAGSFAVGNDHGVWLTSKEVVLGMVEHSGFRDLSPEERARTLSMIDSMASRFRQEAAHSAKQPAQFKPDPEEVEMQALMNSIEQRLVEVHQQIDGVLARWDNG